MLQLEPSSLIAIRNAGRAEPAQLWLPAVLTGVGALAIHLVRRTNKQHAELKRKTGRGGGKDTRGTALAPLGAM